VTKHDFVNNQQSGSRTPHDMPSPSPRKRRKKDQDNAAFDESDSITELSTLSLNVNENNDMVEAPVANPFDESVSLLQHILALINLTLLSAEGWKFKAASLGGPGHA
jgi:hypothetical protein